MKKTLALIICLTVLLLMAGCDFIPSWSTTGATTTTTTAPTDTTATTAETTAETTTETAEPTTTEETTTATPTAAARMYTSYAHMVSYDPARGLADFDYFNLLKGQDAINYLVDHEGYTEANAEALVNGFADSEFVYQNDNPLLRIIDLRNIDLKLMYYPDGTMVTDATPVDSELIDLYNLYHVNPDLVLESYFYRVHVTDGVVTMVEQVYWP